MEAKARVFGHPIHQMLVALPLGLMAGAIFFDCLYLVGAGEKWAEISFWLLAVGLGGGALAAPFGWIDWFPIPKATRAKRIGLAHGLGNVFGLALFALSWLWRRDLPTQPEAIAIALSFLGGAVFLVTGWLGGELVDRLGVGMHDGAHLNAPSSLSGRPAGPPFPGEKTRSIA